MSDSTNVTSEQHLYQTIVQFDKTIVLPRKFATGNIHDYLFCYCPLVGILFEVLRIVLYCVITYDPPPLTPLSVLVSLIWFKFLVHQIERWAEYQPADCYKIKVYRKSILFKIIIIYQYFNLAIITCIYRIA